MSNHSRWRQRMQENSKLGCFLHPEEYGCLHCTLLVCIEEDKDWRKRLQEQRRLKAGELYLEGKTLAEVSAELGLSERTIHRGVRQIATRREGVA